MAKPIQSQPVTKTVPLPVMPVPTSKTEAQIEAERHARVWQGILGKDAPKGK